MRGFVIQDFSVYQKNGTVRSITPDYHRAESLFADSHRKLQVLQRQIAALGVDAELANEYIILCYDILLLCIRAHLYKKGLVSKGLGAHEAEVSYLQELSIPTKDILFLDQMRYFRNGMLYYGKTLDVEYAHAVISFTQSLHAKLLTTHPN